MEALERVSVASGKASRRIIFTFCNLLRDVRGEKENQNHGPQIILPPCSHKSLNLSQLRRFLSEGLAKPLWSLATA